MKKRAEELAASEAQEQNNFSVSDKFLSDIESLTIKEIDSLISEFHKMKGGFHYISNDTIKKTHITKRADKVIDTLIDYLLEERFERKNKGK